MTKTYSTVFSPSLENYGLKENSQLSYRQIIDFALDVIFNGRLEVFKDHYMALRGASIKRHRTSIVLDETLRASIDEVRDYVDQRAGHAQILAALVDYYFKWSREAQ